jgi:thiol-disulfide isomerase/thioredoxin
MKRLSVSVALAVLAAPAFADQPKPAVTLKVGDAAPALKVTKWLQGDEVKAFKKDHVYVVEFWATWCGPCIIMMPHLAELQAQYKSKGVTVIGYTAKDENNTEEKAAAFVKKRGGKLKYAFAYCDDRDTYDAWMKAAGREGIPCSFVVDKQGRIAYVGHPLYLGVVMPKVLAGAKPQAVSDEVSKIEKEYRAVNDALFPDHKVGLQKLKEFEAKYPSLANNPMIVRAKLSLLPKVGKVDEAKQLAEALVKKAIEREDAPALHQVSALLRLGAGKESKELLAVAVKAAEAMVRVAGEDATAQINLASTYLVAGEKSKARQSARKAIKAAASEPAARKEYVEKEAKKILEETDAKK